MVQIRIQLLLKKFEETGYFQVLETLDAVPRTLLLKNLQYLYYDNLRHQPWTVWYTLHKKLHRNKILPRKECMPTDQNRRICVNWQLADEAGFSRKITCSDEGHFTCGGFVNKKNFIYEGKENFRFLVRESIKI